MTAALWVYGDDNAEVKGDRECGEVGAPVHDLSLELSLPEDPNGDKDASNRESHMQMALDQWLAAAHRVWVARLICKGPPGMDRDICEDALSEIAENFLPPLRRAWWWAAAASSGLMASFA
ncbi:hypothetical protein CYMTET_22530 [Cymbomonas tetramitiformis]|uniref:Uncharacterized protein n=1 Tax=Cymbomonas tetramitiformis TaxID=36881 RepID=A0AAE0L241_9CHLO|nr:hypothetical protein CYMTET_22530 [Cymbomonas tetramitiformis]